MATALTFRASWIAGGLPPKPHQQQAWEVAADQIRHNIDILGPGMTLRDLTFKAKETPDEYQRYSLLYHGVGLADEWPSVFFKDSWDEGGVDGPVEVGQVLCVESYVGKRDAPEGVKLEQQVLITETGSELLSTLSARTAVGGRKVPALRFADRIATGQRVGLVEPA